MGQFVIKSGFTRHRKTRRLIKLAGHEAVTALLSLWDFAVGAKPDGNLTGMSPADIEEEAGWTGESGQLFNALVTVAFIDQSSFGQTVLHDWQEHQAIHRPKLQRGQAPLPKTKGLSDDQIVAATERFGVLWTYYPRHDGKQSAWQAFLKLAPNVDTLRAIAADIKKRLKSGEWEPVERRQYIPMLATYLNSQRWLDSE